jgi:hypothetical protein
MYQSRINNLNKKSADSIQAVPNELEPNNKLSTVSEEQQ